MFWTNFVVKMFLCHIGHREQMGSKFALVQSSYILYYPFKKKLTGNPMQKKSTNTTITVNRELSQFITNECYKRILTFIVVYTKNE